MEPPLINILIRTSYRPQLFPRCYESILNQTYRHTRVIVGYDNEQAMNYIPGGVDAVPVSAHKGIPFYYDLYCNQLKKYVDTGWFMFLDDDDFFWKPGSLESIIPYLAEPGAVICQFLRNKRPKPATSLILNKQVVEGKIGLPCLILHSDYKHIGKLDGYHAGDYRYIKEVSERVPTKFVPMVLVSADRRSWGSYEKIFP
jgi:hypothetical protein